MPEAWARRNSFQFKPARLGAGSIPSRRRISHTVVGAIAIPIICDERSETRYLRIPRSALPRGERLSTMIR